MNSRLYALFHNDHEQGEELWALTDDEDVRAWPCEVLVQHVAESPPGRIDALVVEDDDVRLVGGRESIGDRLERAGSHDVVTVDEEQIPPADVLESRLTSEP